MNNLKYGAHAEPDNEDIKAKLAWAQVGRHYVNMPMQNPANITTVKITIFHYQIMIFFSFLL